MENIFAQHNCTTQDTWMEPSTWVPLHVSCIVHPSQLKKKWKREYKIYEVVGRKWGKEGSTFSFTYFQKVIAKKKKK
jgi:hypothetical protein